MKIIALYLSAAVLLPGLAWCGQGSYKDDSPDQVKLYVLFDYKEGDVDSWKPLFKKASRLLYDATKKQVKISEVDFYNDSCQPVRTKIDVLILPGFEKAFASGLLRDIGHIGLSKFHKKDKSTARGHVGLVHEMGHYLFGLLDEYEDESSLPGPGCLAPNASGFDHASLMASGTTELNGRTEFCVDGNHNEGKTEQDKKRPLYDLSTTFLDDSDAWEWIEAFAGERYKAKLVPPQGTPVSDDSGFVDYIDFSKEPCGIRLSAGAYSTRIPEAAAAALEKFIVLLEGDDVAGLVTAGQEVAPIRRMSTDNKFHSLAGIPRADTPAAWTSLLQESLRQVTGGGGESDVTPLSNEVVLLISDGVGSLEGIPKDLLSPIENRGITVHTIGVDDESGAGLPQAAAATGGSYRSADTAADLDAAAMTALAKIKGRGIIEAREGRAEAGETLAPIHIPVDVSTASEAADFLLTWSGPGRDFEMKLLAPDGTEVGAEAPNAIFQNDHDRQVKRYRLLRPAPGRWQVVISNPSSAARDYAFQAHSLAGKVMVVSRASQQVVAFPEPIRLRTFVSIGHPVTGAQVTARIERPDRTVVTIDLLDDGDVETRDAQAGDGIYSGLFTEYRGSGTYEVEISVDSRSGGSTTSPGEPGGTFTPQPVPPFVRKDRFSVVVTGAPD